MGGGLISTIAYMPWNWRRGSLTAKLAPPWPAGWGNIKIAYVAGWASALAILLMECCSWNDFASRVDAFHQLHCGLD